MAEPERVESSALPQKLQHVRQCKLDKEAILQEFAIAMLIAMLIATLVAMLVAMLIATLIAMLIAMLVALLIAM